MKRIGFIGVGKVGTAFGVRLSQAGFPVLGAMDIVPAEAQRFAASVPGCTVVPTAQQLADSSDFVFITTPDDVIPVIASQVRWHMGQSVIHCSGANSVAILEPARGLGANVGCMHPCNSFASIQQSIENLPGSTFTLEAEEPVLSELKSMVDALRGKWMVLKEEDKGLYHASLCISCNYLYTLVNICAEMWRHFGISPEDALTACMPILKGAINNLDHVGLPQALSGPIARGDVSTIRTHLQALRQREPELIPLYKLLGRETIPIGRAKGTLSEEKAAELRELLKD